MSYATRSEMLARYGEDALRRLTDRKRELGAIEETALSAAISSANSRVAGAVMAGGYPAGFEDALLTQHACTLAYWSLHTGERTKDLNDSHAAAIADLDRVANRSLVLAVAAPTAAPVSIQGGSREFSFSGGTLSGYTEIRRGWY